MRPPYYTITPAVVRSTASAALREALPWQGYGRRVTVGPLLDLLLLTASLVSSLSAVVKRFRFGSSDETALEAVASNLPEVGPPTDGLVDALYLFGSRALRRRKWVVAIDEHRTPFYGDRSTFGVTAYKFWCLKFNEPLLAQEGSVGVSDFCLNLEDSLLSCTTKRQWSIIEKDFKRKISIHIKRHSFRNIQNFNTNDL